ncbi:MAG: hypothetical protein F4Y60_08800 [Boseongicola sp. SB0664_bin_43]|uniref:Single cache domain-containing protein n=1 Tax=Boseongicola sp. SB0664_bin_43 TaxID=2604844 RepID=A0A6B0Y2Z6_9RHOB|nr:hypothetical protein [Boseongicola sp. SB0664_bin_43]
MRPGRLTIEFIFILCLLPVVGLSAAGFLNYLKFERLLTSSVAARYDAVLRDLAFAIGNSLEEGLTLGTTRSTEQLIQRAVSQFDGAFDIFVTDGEGVLLYTTRPAAEEQERAANGEGVAGIEVPSPGEVQHTFDPGQDFVARTAILQQDRPVGILVLTHDSGDVAKDLDATPSQLILALFASLLPVIPLLILGSVGVLGRIEGQISKRSKTVQLASKTDAPEPESPDPLVQAVWRIGQEMAKVGRTG